MTRQDLEFSKKTMEREKCSSSPPAGAEIESFGCPDELANPRKKKINNKNKNKNKRRFSDEQISLLESMFESETKLEPRKKMQLARDLGLQPRQVAIWFQNRRARWKSKKIEQNYRVLKASYDDLQSRFESLNREKQFLLSQLHKLSDLLENRHDGGDKGKDLGGNSSSGGFDIGDNNGDFKTKPNGLDDGSDRGAVAYSDDDERGNEKNFLGEEAELPNTTGCISLAMPEKLCNFDSGGVFDQSCGGSNWWEFWT
ncbi:hypothetical protein U1Q18_031844 [Sarracenia purpurea var. burkii]